MMHPAISNWLPKSYIVPFDRLMLDILATHADRMAINIENRYSTRGDLVRARATPARCAARAQEKEKSKRGWNMSETERERRDL